MSDSKHLGYRTILHFWLPLALTWLMMALEGPFLAAVIARMAAPKFNLAAFGVTFSFAIIMEAPVIMLLSAATALVDSANSFRKLRNFTLLLNGGITLGMMLLLVPPLFNFIMDDLIGLPEEVRHLAYRALMIMLPWPGAIGYRRFYQGILIRSGLTRRVAYGTIVRLSSMALATLLLFFTTELAGCWIAAVGLSVGVCCEGLASRLMSRGAVRNLLAAASTDNGDLSYRAILDFYAPLALTSIISLGVQPMVTFFMGQARFSLESLAILPVTGSLLFIFKTPGLSYQEVAITLLSKRRAHLGRINRFAAGVAGIATLALAALVWSPLIDLWLRSISGLSPELASFAVIPLRIATILPALEVLLAVQRAMMVDSRKTAKITLATIIEVSGLVLSLLLLVKGLDLIGVVAANISFVIARLMGNLSLLPACIRYRKLS
ncbi:MAG: hypothetical protein GY835_25750 [bacterium]|nr:hypothetical protein [bacterium]